MNIDSIIKIIKETDSIFFNDSLRLDVRQKGDSDFVTRADLEVSDYLRVRLKECYPEIGFISEETGELGSPWLEAVLNFSSDPWSTI